MKNREKRLNCGFTLLELLLGLAIFSIIGLCVYSVFASGIGLSRRSEGRVAIYRDARMALDLMSRELENMVDYQLPSGDEEKWAFVGEKDKISFILSTEEELKWVSYYLVRPDVGHIEQTIIGETYEKNVDIDLENVEQEQTYWLMREEIPFVEYLSSSEVQSPSVEIIATNVKEKELKFQFGFVEGESTETYQWMDGWGQLGIPANIRIDLKMADVEQSGQTIDFQYDVFIPQGTKGVHES